MASKAMEGSKWGRGTGDESMQSKLIVTYIYYVSRFTLDIWKDRINIMVCC